MSSVKRTVGLEHKSGLAVAVPAISGYVRIGRASAERSLFPAARSSRQRNFIATVLLAARRGRIPYSPAWRVFRSVVGHSCICKSPTSPPKVERRMSAVEASTAIHPKAWSWIAA
jgi:hypothetical protein